MWPVGSCWGGGGGGLVCSPVASRRSWGSASQPEPHTRKSWGVWVLGSQRMDTWPLSQRSILVFASFRGNAATKAPISAGAAGVREGRQQVSDPMDRREPSHPFEQAGTPACRRAARARTHSRLRFLFVRSLVPSAGDLGDIRLPSRLLPPLQNAASPAEQGGPRMNEIAGRRPVFLVWPPSATALDDSRVERMTHVTGKPPEVPPETEHASAKGGGLAKRKPPPTSSSQ